MLIWTKFLFRYGYFYLTQAWLFHFICIFLQLLIFISQIPWQLFPLIWVFTFQHYIFFMHCLVFISLLTILETSLRIYSFFIGALKQKHLANSFIFLHQLGDFHTVLQFFYFLIFIVWFIFLKECWRFQLFCFHFSRCSRISFFPLERPYWHWFSF